MYPINIYLLKSFKKIYQFIYHINKPLKPECNKDKEVVGQEIYHALISDKPCMIARFGNNEIACLSNYIAIKNKSRQYISYIKGIAQPWWWELNNIHLLQQGAGFFPGDEDKIEAFCDLMIKDISKIDVLGSWLPQELLFEKELKQAFKVDLELLNPYFSKIPWTKALEGKKVLVVHPFAETIKSQYKKRELLFKNNLLPAFELKTIKAVQTIAGEQTEFADWFDALDYMKNEIDKVDYDICLIGCGAYGFPLAAHVKYKGKKGFHMGGSLQLLFGIKGKRWEDENYNPTYNYSILMNEHWVRPNKQDKPLNANMIEGACYW